MIEPEGAINKANPILYTTQTITGNSNLTHIDPLGMIGFNFDNQYNDLEQKAIVND